MTVEDITAELDKETGSAFTNENVLFTAFEDGAIFQYEDAEVRDFDNMLNKDGKAATLEKVLTLPIRQAPWSIKKGQATSSTVNFIESVLTEPANNGGMSTPMNMIIAQALSAIVYRRAFFEKVFTEKDGKVVYDKLAFRPPATCAIRRDKRTAAFTGFNQMPIRYDDTEEIYIPAHRAWVYIHGTHRDPLQGVSDMTIPYWCFQTKQKIRFLWYSFLEGQALPKTVVKAPDSTTAQTAAKEIVKLRQGGAVGVANEITVDAFESSGRGASQFLEALKWLDQEASGSVLAGFTDLTGAATGGTGSFALSKDQTDFFLMSRQAVSKELADSINNFVIPDLVRYNFGVKAKSPTFEFGPISQDDMNQSISLLQATSQSKSPVIPQEFFDELVVRVAGFLELDVRTVRDGLERARKEAEEQAKQTVGPDGVEVAGMAGAVNAATGAVMQKTGAQNDGNPKPPGPDITQSRPPQAGRPVDTRVRH